MGRPNCTRRTLAVGLVSIACLAVGSIPTAASAVPTSIGVPSSHVHSSTPLKYLWSFATSISGNIVVGQAGFPDTTYPHAFAYDLSTSGPMIDLGTLPGYQYSEASGIAGNVVIGEAIVNGNQYEAFAYDLSTHTMTDLGTLGGFGNTVALHVSGDIVVGYSATTAGPGPDYPHAFAYNLSTSGPMTDLGTLPGDDYSEPSGISGNTVVGLSSRYSGGYMHAFAYDLSTSTMTDLGTIPGNQYSEATGISGNIVAGYSGVYGSTPQADAFAYDLTTHAMTDLGNLGGNANCYNALGGINGSIVVGDSYTAGGACHAFAYDLGTHAMTDLGTLGGTNSIDADPIFASGSQPFDGNTVVGDSNTTAGVVHAYAYNVATSGPMIDLGDLAASRTYNSTIGSITSSAAAASGNIVVGWAISADGQQHAFAYDLTTATMTDLGTGEIFTNSLPTGSVGVRYSAQMVASGGAPAHSVRASAAKGAAKGRVRNKWKVIAGSLPGLHLRASGRITGRPKSKGTYTFTVRVINAANTTATQRLSIIVK